MSRTIKRLSLSVKLGCRTSGRYSCAWRLFLGDRVRKPIYNSWMHSLHVLAKGKDRCTLLVHPDDAARLTLVNGDRACVTSQAGTVEIPVEVTDTIMPGVVSIPHGWGHALPGTQMRVAREHAGVNTNILTVEENVEPLSGNAILNGVAVTVERAEA